MIAHIIHYEGKGYLVFLLPLLTAFVLFVIFDGANEEPLVGPSSFLISSTLIYLVDKKSIKKPNSFMWIKMRYCAVIIWVIGFIWFTSKYLTK